MHQAICPSDKSDNENCVERILKATDRVVAVSRVSEELLGVLGVRQGGFTRADGRPFEGLTEISIRRYD